MKYRCIILEKNCFYWLIDINLKKVRILINEYVIIVGWLDDKINIEIINLDV